MFAKKAQSILLLAIVGFCVVESRTLAGDPMKDLALKTAAEMIERGEKVLEKLPKDDELRQQIEEDVQKFKDLKDELEKSDVPTTENRLSVFIFTLEAEYLPILRQAEEKVKNITGNPTTGTPSAAPTTGTPSAAPTTGTPSAAPTTGTPSAASTTPTPSAAPTTGTPAESTPVA